jgi:hypothetical protein
MNWKEHCLELVKCDTEAEVIALLSKLGLWDDPEAWQYFDNEENNYSTIGNQQSKPETALVEKLINSVDAVLMGACQARGVKTDAPEAPQSIKDALIKYYSIDEGKLTNISANERSKLAENIGLIATGQKSNPTFAIVDRGEGQSPAKLPSTILSLRKSNKLRVPFVQGKFNMGGTGVFRFCGERNIQLVLSRRNPVIAAKDHDPTADFWGFTVIRRDDPAHGARSSNYKYLAPNSIPFFAADGLDILPSEYPNAYGTTMTYGTFIKLYEYNIGPGLRTNILFDLYNKLSVLMPQLALPIKLYERRKGYSGHSFEGILAGLSVRIDEDKSDNIEEGFPTSGLLPVNGQKMRYSIYVFKKGKHEKYTKDEGIIFSINGQTHGYLPKSFFNRKAVGLGYLAESILVVLDCSEINPRDREVLFMNSRDRLSSCALRADIERELEDALKNHPGLRLLKEKRRREEVESKLKDSKPLSEILENVLRTSPTLARLFVRGQNISNPFASEGAAAAPVFHGREFPTVFSLLKKYPESKPKPAHHGSKFRVDFRTDVANDYFDRGKDPGSIQVFLNGVSSEDYSINLWNGIAHLNIGMKTASIGDLIQVRTEVMDVSRVLPIIEDFFALITAPLSKGNGGVGSRKPPSSENEGNESAKPNGFALPNIIEVTHDGRSGHQWNKQNFNGHSALCVKGSNEDGYDFFVNTDNVHLLTEIKARRDEDLRAIEARYKFGLVLIGLAMIQDDEKNGANDENGDILAKISQVASAISPVILPMIESLSAIEMDALLVMPVEEA